MLTSEISEIVSKAKMSFKRENFKHEKEAVGGCLRLKSYTATTQPPRQSRAEYNAIFMFQMPHQVTRQAVRTSLINRKPVKQPTVSPHYTPHSLKHSETGLIWFNSKNNALVSDE